MKTRVIYTKNALKDLRNLHKTEANKIVLKMEFYSKQKNPLEYAKKLKPPFEGLLLLCNFVVCESVANK